MRRTCFRFGLLGLASFAGMASAGAQQAEVLLRSGAGLNLDPPRVQKPLPKLAEYGVADAAGVEVLDAEELNAEELNGEISAGAEISLRPAAGDAVQSIAAEETSAAASSPGSRMPRGVRFGSDVPSLRVNTEGPDTLVVGKPAEYRITLANQSEFAAGHVMVRIQIPTWVELHQHDATVGAIQRQTAVEDGSEQLVWNVDQIAGDGEQTLTLMLVPRAGRAFELGVDVSVRPTSSATKIAVKEPKIQLRLEGNTEVVSGTPARWTVVLDNPGTGDAQNVSLDLFSGTEKVGTQQVGRIAAGTQRIVDVTLPTPRGGQQRLRAVAVAEPGLTAEASAVYLVRRGELDVQVQGPAFEYTGTHATYDVRVSNTGDAVANDVRMQFLLPSGAKYIGRLDSGAAKPVQLPAGLQWTVASIEPGAEEAFRITCELSQAGDHQATVQATNEDGLQAAAEVRTHVEAAADLQLQVIDPAGPRAVGSAVEIEVRVTNRGTAAARQVYISALCPEGTELVDVTGSASIEAGQIFFQPIEALEAGETFSQRVTIRAAEAGGHVFRATVECEEPELQLACDEYTRFFVRDAEPVSETQTETRTASPLPIRKITIR